MNPAPGLSLRKVSNPEINAPEEADLVSGEAPGPASFHVSGELSILPGAHPNGTGGGFS